MNAQQGGAGASKAVMTSPEQIQRLRAFGLSESQARTYVALLELGVADAREVSRLSKVPVTRVYPVLEQLKERGLALMTPGVPRTYSPVPIGEFLDALRFEHVTRAEHLAAQKAEMAELFPISGATNADDRGTVALFRGRFSGTQKLRTCLEEAKRDVLYVGSPATARRRVTLPLLHEAASRGVRCRALLPVSQGLDEAVEAYGDLVEFRERPAPLGRVEATGLLVVDGRVAVGFHFVPDDESRFKAKDFGLVLMETALVETLQSLLEQVWLTARVLEPSRSRPLDASASVARG